MSRRGLPALRGALLSPLVALVLAAPLGAIETPLLPRSIGDAVASGAAMAQHGGGYAVGPYVVYAAEDTLRVSDAAGPIEAVTVGTPYERLRYEAYLLAHQRKPFDRTAAAEYAATTATRLDFVVFLHSRADEGREFLSRYGGATLSAGGTTATPSAIERTTPVTDTYLAPGERVVERWLGQVTYRFDLAANPALVNASSATFSFVDDRGVAHAYPVGLARLR